MILINGSTSSQSNAMTESNGSTGIQHTSTFYGSTSSDNTTGLQLKPTSSNGSMSSHTYMCKAIC